MIEMSEEEVIKQINKLRKWFAEHRREHNRIRKQLERGEPSEFTATQLIDKIIKTTDEFDRRLKEILKT